LTFLVSQISDGGVHSHITHLFALLETAKQVGVPHAYVHFFGDGRDTAPTSATQYLQQLLDFVKKEKYGELATIVGRYYAMDRDKRWERIKIAVEGLVNGDGEDGKGHSGAVGVVEENYKKNITDEFLRPIIVNGSEGRVQGTVDNACVERPSDRLWAEGDTLFFFNYRSDRMREIVTVFGKVEDVVDTRIPKDLVRLSRINRMACSERLQGIFTMSSYKSTFPFLVAFPPQKMDNVLAEWLAKQDVSQSHVAGNLNSVERLQARS